VSRGPVFATPAAFALDNEVYRLRRDWTPVLSVLPYQGWPTPFVAAMLAPKPLARLSERLYDPDDPLDTPDVEEVAQALVAAATGWPWYSAARLAGWAVGDWPLAAGLLRMRGVHLAKIVRSEPALALNTVYALLVDHADEKKRMQLDAELDVPPPGAAPQGWTAEQEGEMFLAALERG
jgi:hypothetical protein